MTQIAQWPTRNCRWPRSVAVMLGWSNPTRPQHAPGDQHGTMPCAVGLQSRWDGRISQMCPLR